MELKRGEGKQKFWKWGKLGQEVTLKKGGLEFLYKLWTLIRSAARIFHLTIVIQSADRIFDLKIRIRPADRMFHLKMLIRSGDRIFDLEIFIRSSVQIFDLKILIWFECRIQFAWCFSVKLKSIKLKKTKLY